ACAVRASDTCAPPKSNIAVAVDVPGHTYWLDAVALRAVPILEPAGSIAALSTSPNFTKAISGETKLPHEGSTPVTWAWTISKAAGSGAMKLTARQPTFTAIYHDIPGLDANAFAPAIVRVPAGTLVAFARGRADEGGRDVADWLIASEIKYEV